MSAWCPSPSGRSRRCSRMGGTAESRRWSSASLRRPARLEHRSRRTRRWCRRLQPEWSLTPAPDLRLGTSFSSIRTRTIGACQSMAARHRWSAPTVCFERFDCQPVNTSWSSATALVRSFSAPQLRRWRSSRPWDSGWVGRPGDRWARDEQGNAAEPFSKIPAPGFAPAHGCACLPEITGMDGSLLSVPAGRCYSDRTLQLTFFPH